MKVPYNRMLAATAAAFILAAGVSPLVSAQGVRAQEAREQAQERRETARQSVEDRGAEQRTTAEERKEAGQLRAQEGKLKACQNREKAIRNILSRIADRSEKQVVLFTTIADRTKTFSTEKALTVENYDALVAEVDAKKLAAEEAITQIRAIESEFTCEGEDPKAATTAFKDSLKTQIAVLKEYRTSVKNLIVAVKSAQDATTEETTEEETTETEESTTTTEEGSAQ